MRMNAANAPRAAASVDVNGQAVPRALTKLKVLIIDHSRFTRAIIRNALNTYGISETTEAMDTATGLDILRSDPIDLVVIDLEMPLLDGSDFTKMIRTGGDVPDAEVPIMVVSGFSDRNRITKAMNAGINDYLTKPFSPEALYRRVHDVIMRPRGFVRTREYTGPCRRG